MKIKVVFLKDNKWWYRGQIKQVAPALFNNVLKPQGLAVKADSAEAKNLLSKIQKQQSQHEKEIQTIKNLIQQLSQNPLTIEKNLTPWWHFYDKIDSKEISEIIIKQYWIKIPTDKIKLKEKINQPWEYDFKISFHWIDANLKLIVKGK